MIRSCRNNTANNESGALNLWSCSFIETRRNIWQNMFWGIAGSFDWEIESLPENMKNFSIYGRVREFFDGVNLEGEGWHSGMVKLDNQDKWKFKQSYLDDCIREDELADVVYLRSENKEKAMGVITNRRANYWTTSIVDTCFSVDGVTPAPEPLHSDHGEENILGNKVWDKYSDSLQTYSGVYPDGGNQRLRIRNMALGFLGAPKKYKIKYYSPYDQLNPIKEETRWAPQLTLEFPELDTLDIVLFEVFPNGENFKSAEGDTSSTDREKTKLPKNEMQEPEVLVYPNPNKGNFKVLIGNPYETKAIYLTNNIGKHIDSRLHVEKYNIFNMENPKPGVYFLVVVFQDKVIRRKIIIN